MVEIYYRSKIITLMEMLFVETGDARSRIINCEGKIKAAFDASYSKGVPVEVRLHWEIIMKELQTREDVFINKQLLITGFHDTIKRKRNKTMEKHLHFILKEFYRVI